MAKKTKQPKLSSMVAKAYPLKPTAEDKARERRYMAEDDIRTIQRAGEIEKDKDRMKAMKEVAKEQIASLKKVCP